MKKSIKLLIIILMGIMFFGCDNTGETVVDQSDNQFTTRLAPGGTYYEQLYRRSNGKGETSTYRTHSNGKRTFKVASDWHETNVYFYKRHRMFQGYQLILSKRLHQGESISCTQTLTRFQGFKAVVELASGYSYCSYTIKLD